MMSRSKDVGLAVVEFVDDGLADVGLSGVDPSGVGRSDVGPSDIGLTCLLALTLSVVEDI